MANSKYDDMPPRPKLTKADAKEEILKLLRRSVRPLLIGTASLHLGGFWTLEVTEVVFRELIEEGRIRELSPKECAAVGVVEGFVRVES